jgi:hypothetical protein
MDIVVPATLVAVWVGCFLYQLRGRAILPVYDPQFRELGASIGHATGPSTARQG